jgi:hypothetical protein
MIQTFARSRPLLAFGHADLASDIQYLPRKNMKDAYERRALLLHLGDVMQTLSRILEYESDDEALGELIAANDILADVALLEHVSAQTTVREFATRALHAFCLWPQQLLEHPLDHEALAASVREHLFAGNPNGWQAYAAALRADVPWFGEGLPPMNADYGRAGAGDEDRPPPDSPDSVKANEDWRHTDVERDGEQARKRKEGVEGLGHSYPYGHWKVDV